MKRYWMMTIEPKWVRTPLSTPPPHKTICTTSSPVEVVLEHEHRILFAIQISAEEFNTLVAQGVRSF